MTSDEPTDDGRQFWCDQHGMTLEELQMWCYMSNMPPDEYMMWLDELEDSRMREKVERRGDRDHREKARQLPDPEKITRVHVRTPDDNGPYFDTAQFDVQLFHNPECVYMLSGTYVWSEGLPVVREVINLRCTGRGTHKPVKLAKAILDAKKYRMLGAILPMRGYWPPQWSEDGEILEAPRFTCPSCRMDFPIDPLKLWQIIVGAMKAGQDLDMSNVQRAMTRR